MGDAVNRIDRRLATLYGECDWRDWAGCIQVAAIEAKDHRVIAIGPSAPRSATDRFILGFARARADVILTTGAILRAEPDLRHCYAETEDENRAWAAWRAARLGRSEEPRLLVLSRRGEFPMEHPAFIGRKGWLFSGPVDEAVDFALPPGFERVEGAGDAGGARAAVAAVLEFFASKDRRVTISIEAGPTTASSFYAPEASDDRVDELLLSRFEGRLDPAAIGPSFIDPARIDATLGSPLCETRMQEVSGAWCFARYRR